MNLYLIDFENVGESGLAGVSALGSDSIVTIFYGNNNKALSFEKTVELVNCRAAVEFIKAEKAGKNYLDFWLSTYLGYLLGTGKKGNVLIISKDTGFDSLVDFWSRKSVNICRKDAVSGSAAKAPSPANTRSPARDFPEAFRKKARAALKDSGFQPGCYTHIYNAFVSSDSKTAFNNCLVKAFGSEKGGNAYQRLKDIFEEFRSTIPQST